MTGRAKSLLLVILKTQDDNMAEAVTKAFVDMYNKGLIYRDKRLVNWDPHFQTAISDLEVENIEKDGQLLAFQIPASGWRNLHIY